MADVVPFRLPIGQRRTATISALHWLYKKLDEGQEPRLEKFIRARIEILEARVGSQR